MSGSTTRNVTTTTAFFTIHLLLLLNVDHSLASSEERRNVHHRVHHKKRSLPGEHTALEPKVLGLRIEDLDKPHPPAFDGYTEARCNGVHEDVPCSIVMFGQNLHLVDRVDITDSNCITAEFKKGPEDFMVHTDTMIQFVAQFPNVDDEWRFCIKSRFEDESAFVEDERTFVCTSHVTREHFLPLSIQILIIFMLFSMSALFSGLNLGLMSLTVQELQLIINSGSKKERMYAEKILPIRKRGNYLLCTILIMNVVVNSAISILFEDLTTGTIAFAVASLGIVVCGEIIPQSVCVKNGLAVGAHTVWITRFFMFITLPVALPISKVLDCVLGEEVERYDRKRLIEIMKMEIKNENKDFAADLKIAVGAMEIGNKQVRDVMTRIDDTFMLSEDEILSQQTVHHILKKGYSRIPVYEGSDRGKVKSLLFVADLALVNLKHNVTVKYVSEYNKHMLRIVLDTMPLPDLLEEFKKGDYHLALVERAVEDSPVRENKFIMQKLAEFKDNDCTLTLTTRWPIISEGNEEDSSPTEETPLASNREEMESSVSPVPSSGRSSGGTGELVGLITLEDIIEEILQAEIIDESDAVLDNVHRAKRRMNECFDEMWNAESKEPQLGVNEYEVAERFLRDKFTLFSDTFMDPYVRKKLIQKNIRKVFIHKKARESHRHGMLLYTKGTASKRAIIVLEGSANVYFDCGLKFYATAWTMIGESRLQNVQKEIISGSRLTSLTYIPDFDVRVKDSCRFLQIPYNQLLHAFRVTQFLRTIPKDTRSFSEEVRTDDIERTEKVRTLSSEAVSSRKLSSFPILSEAVKSKKSVAF